MSNVAVFNGYGQYEQTNDGQKGITLTHGGVPFWLPFDEVTYLPDFTLREVDHATSTADQGEEGFLSYKTLRVTGGRLAEELLDTQVPYKNRDRGIITIENDPKKRKNSYVSVFAGCDEEGRRIMTDVQEIEPTTAEIAEAHRLARVYKEEIIQQYILGKRERMMGGAGHQPFPTGLIRTYMTELGVKDADDVTDKMQQVASQPGLTQEMFLAALKEILAPKAAIPVPAKGGKQELAQSIV